MPGLEKKLSAFEASVTHHTVQNGDVPIHYASVGDGPLVIFLHGFPDHWLTWWQQMDALSSSYHCVAMDLRGYNLSGQPDEMDCYSPDLLALDVKAVLENCGEQSAVIIGHDWGAFVAWTFAMQHPACVSRLTIINMPHPWAIARELALNPDQVKASAYVRHFQQPDAHLQLDFDRLSSWIRDEAFKKRHIIAMERSNPNAMLNYYRSCFPAPPYSELTVPPVPILSPTLIVHGLEDPYALPAGLNGVWSWVNAELNIKTWPGVGHFVQQEKPERLTRVLSQWLDLNLESDQLYQSGAV